MTSPLVRPRDRLLTPNDLDTAKLDTVFSSILSRDIDYADLYFQSLQRESWRLDEGTIKSGSHVRRQGVGVRAIAGERSALSYSDDISLLALSTAAATTRSIGAGGGASHAVASAPARYIAPSFYGADDPADLPTDSRVTLLKQLDQLTRAADARVVRVIAILQLQHEHVFLARSDGFTADDARPLVRLDVEVQVEQNGRRMSAHAAGGGRIGLSDFADGRMQAIAMRAVHAAIARLDARPAPSGPMTVVMGPGFPGVLLHEAVGHGLEGDFLRKGSSAFAGLIGERVAAPGVTVVDDGGIMDRRGSLSVDDEGQPAQRTVLIEDGILKGFMHDLHNARLLGLQSTGNGRRESYAAMPLPRMTNTFMLGGTHEPDEIVASVQNGIYVADVGGGQVDITNGKFVFAASDAYLIENGRITAPLVGATLIGDGPQILNRVCMIGNDLSLDPGSASCRKDGQTVPVGVGQPTLRIDGFTVGGTA